MGLIYDGRIYFSLALIMACDYLQVPLQNVRFVPGEYIELPDAHLPDGTVSTFQVPVTEQCEMLVNWAGSYHSTFRHLPYNLILDFSEFDPDNRALFTQRVHRAMVESEGKMVPEPVTDFAWTVEPVQLPPHEDLRIDELRNLIERMDARLGKLVADVDFRLTALESTSQAASGNGQTLELPDPAGSDPARTGGASSLVDTDEGYQPSGAPRILGTIPLEDGVVEPIAPEPQQTARASVLPDGTPEERYKYALGLLRKAQYDEADSVLSAFIEVHGDHPLADNASFWRGETFYARKMFGDAARIYATNLQTYSKGGKAPDNMVKLGMALANLERTREACQAFAELDRKYPDMPANVRQAAERGRNAARCP